MALCPRLSPGLPLSLQALVLGSHTTPSVGCQAQASPSVPSTVSWTGTTGLPVGLSGHAVAAATLPGATPTSVVYVVGGADNTHEEAQGRLVLLTLRAPSEHSPGRSATVRCSGPPRPSQRIFISPCPIKPRAGAAAPRCAPGRHCPTCGADVSSQQGQVATAYVTPEDAARMAHGQSAQLDALRRATLGHYDIQGELGQGGMATVYLAHDIALDRKVAIKVMSPALFATAGMVERFKREARTAAALSHPHIIPIYAVRDGADFVYFVMKFVEGRSLESITRAAGPLPLPLVRAVLYQVGEALGYAHRRGVVHRDVKPANVMLDTGGWVVVTDFGIAKVAETQGLTMTGATIGTPSYMSPEQCEAKRELPQPGPGAAGLSQHDDPAGPGLGRVLDGCERPAGHPAHRLARRAGRSHRREPRGLVRI